MGKRGPRPIPTRLKLLRGNPGKRPVNDAEPDLEPLSAEHPLARCPKWLKGDAKTLWERVVPGSIAIGLLTIVDLPTLEAYCLSYARWRAFERLTDRVGLERSIRMRLRSAAVTERQFMMQLGARFGFDPSSRTNVKLPKAEPRNPLKERYLGRRNGP